MMLQPNAIAEKPILRLFIDPASKSTGWALFSDSGLVHHGSVVAPEGDPSERLLWLFERYAAIAGLYKPDEVVIERMNFTVAYVVVWSAGVILTAIRKGAPQAPQHQMSPATWKKYLDSLGLKRSHVAAMFGCETEDEATAILMGQAFTYNLEDTHE
jgi:Holliday junction resolvasome RuvABC endonuclease subunit